MKPIRALSLHLALPLLVLGTFVSLWAFSVAYQYRQTLNSIEAAAQEDLRQILANAELRIEGALRHQQPAMLAEEIAAFGVNPAINSAMLIDERGTVMQATRLEWIGRDYRSVAGNFDGQICPSDQDRQVKRIAFASDRQNLYGCRHIDLAGDSDQIRPNNSGYLLIEFDLSRAKAGAWQTLVASTYPNWLAALAVMLAMAAMIKYWLDRPLRHLTDVVARFASGDYAAKTNLTGHGELATLGRVWNQMSQGLQQAIEQLDEQRERLEVTLYSIGDAVIATDAESKVTFVNQVAQDLTGWTMAEAEGRLLEEVFVIINAQTRQGVENPVKRVLSSGKILGLANHTVLVSRNGREYQIADSAAPIRGRAGEIFGVILVFRDVTKEYRLRHALMHEHAMLRSLVDAVPDLIFYKSTEFAYLGCNKAFETFAARSEVELIGKRDTDLFGAELAHSIRASDAAALQSNSPQQFEQWVDYPDGRKVLFETVKTPFHNPEGTILGLVGISRDITERRLYEDRLAASEQQLRSLGNNLPSGYIYQYRIDPQGKPSFTFISEGVEKIHGISAESILKDPELLLAQIVPEQQDWYRAEQNLSEIGLQDFSMELRMLRADAEVRWLQICSRPRRDNGSTVWDGLAIDITEKKLSQEQIWRQANFDPLTGLPNRQMFLDRLEQEIKKARRAQSLFALLFIDLDRFKEVNDTLGHMLGDQLLRIAAKRLEGCVRTSDTVARLGGDEFTVLLTGQDNHEVAARVAETILRQMSEPFPLNGESAYVSASIGITLYPNDAEEAAQLLQNADQAMYAAKDKGRNCYSYFTMEMQNAAQNRLDMGRDLRQALAQRQFEVYYQPIVDLNDGRIGKAEALIRWHHPVKGMVSPALFIPVAEENGLINEIGDWVFRQAAQQVKQWRTGRVADFQVSINKSPVQFRTLENQTRDWPSQLAELGLPGSSVVIEITEGLLLDTSPNTSQKLFDYQQAGIQVSLDDFGTGYSSLSYIQKFDIDFLKIDKRFIADLSAESTNLALCEAMILMAHKLGMKVVAEGIETEQQRDLLKAIGCDYGQGYLFSRPVPAEQFEALLAGQKAF